MIFCKTLKLIMSGVLIAAAALSGGCDLNANKPDRSPRPVHFTLGVEQDGQRISVRNHEVILKKKPFRLVFYFNQMGSMLVQASFSPRTMQQAGAGRSLNEMIRPDAGIVEGPNNPEKALYVGEKPYHNWLCFGPENHRFDLNEVHPLGRDGNEGFLCRRTVEWVVDYDKDQDAKISVADCPAGTIYMVFIMADRRPGGRRAERQRDWLKIKFR